MMKTPHLFLTRLFSVTCLLLFAAASFAKPSKTDQWQGYERDHYQVGQRSGFVIKPQQALSGNPWIWRARFFGHQPQADLALLKLGFHLAYCDVSNDFGSPTAVDRWNQFYQLMIAEQQLNKKVALEGMSRGGLIIYNWAIANPEKVACIYADNPVLDIRSWPGGGSPEKRDQPTWQHCLTAYLLTEESLSKYSPPLADLKILAEAKIPLLHVIGTADEVVPPAENTDLLEKKYQELGGDIHVIRKQESGHHPHSLDDPRPIIRFVLQHSGFDPDLAGTNNYQVRSNFLNSRIQFEREKLATVAFIGGSITEMEGYRPMICQWLQEGFPDTEFKFVTAGISSTCSTTGAMRVDRDVLSKGPIDLFFIEFAVNDDQDAAHSRTNCIRGMEGIIRQVRKANPQTDIVMTHFVNPSMLATFQSHQIPKTIEAHTHVAHYYQVTTNNLAKEVADQITANELTWKKFGGTHPKPPGNRICANMIIEFLTDAWKAELPGTAQKINNSLPQRLIDPFSYEKGRFIPIENAKLKSDWKIETPAWSTIAGSKRERYTSLKMLTATKPGATLKLEFEGKAIGAFVVAGPDAGRVEVSIDGAEFEQVDLYHRYSRGLHYPRTVMFANQLTAGKHTLELKVSKETSSQGTAVRIMEFVGN